MEQTTIPDFGHCESLALENAAIARVINRFPDTFKLKGHAHMCRIDEQSSYISSGCAMLVVQKFVNNKWIEFTKGTAGQLVSELDISSMQPN